MILDYLYYKLYHASLKSSLKDIPEFFAVIYLGGLLCVNLLILNAFLTKIHIGHFLFTNSKLGGGLCILIIVLLGFYYRKQKRETVLQRYASETNKQRIRGNVIVSIYILLSFVLIFVVAFWRVGVL